MNTRIVDAHHHIWLRDRTPWPAGPMVPRIFGEYQGIRRDYLIEVRDYLLEETPTTVGVMASPWLPGYVLTVRLRHWPPRP